jgi:hypothetical protein
MCYAPKEIECPKEPEEPKEPKCEPGMAMTLISELSISLSKCITSMTIKDQVCQ